MRQARGQKSPLKNHFRPEFQLEFLKNSNWSYTKFFPEKQKKRQIEGIEGFYQYFFDFFGILRISVKKAAGFAL